MKVINGINNLNKLDKSSVVTIGVFDGVHVGHQKIIKKAILKAKKGKIYSVVVTFDPHPLDVLRPKSYPTILTGLNSKIRLLEYLRVDILLVIKFNKTFAKMSASKFIKEILVEKLRVSSVIIGKGFRFGANAKGDTDFLIKQGKELCFDVEDVALDKTSDNLKISSTRIRNLLKEGELEEARQILGHPIIISGVVKVGEGNGAITGFNTANIETDDKASIPKEGVYAGFARLSKKKLPSVIHIGPSPTFDIRKKRIEVHILNHSKPLYEKELEVELVARLRGTMKFKTPRDLGIQIKKDIAKANKYF